MRVYAPGPRRLAGAELVDDVEMGRNPATGLLSGEQIDGELRFDLDAIVADLVAPRRAGRCTSEGMNRGSAKGDEDGLEREPDTRNGGGHVERKDQLEHRFARG